MRKIVFMIGPPACGKGLQGNMLAQVKRKGREENFLHVEMSALITRYTKTHPSVATSTMSAMAGGVLVDNALVIKICGSFIVKNPDRDLVIDGFPRTVEQAEFAVSLVSENLDFIIFELNDAECHTRVRERREERTRKLAEMSERGGTAVLEKVEQVQRVDDDPAIHADRLRRYRKTEREVQDFLFQHISERCSVYDLFAGTDPVSISREVFFIVGV